MGTPCDGGAFVLLALDMKGIYRAPLISPHTGPVMWGFFIFFNANLRRHGAQTTVIERNEIWYIRWRHIYHNVIAIYVIV